MSKWQECFVRYLDCYVRKVTKDKEEFFLSFCDVEEVLLEGLDTSRLTEYRVVIVNNRDYSEAVRMRNAVDVLKIVLLSGEGIKQIDSLKDFNEYPVMAENKEILWDCLQAALKLSSFHKDVRPFLAAVLDYSEIALSTLMAYLDKSVEEAQGRKISAALLQKSTETKAQNVRRFLSPVKLNENLPMLGVWKSSKTGYLNKGETGRILRASRYSVVESRLTKAVMNRKIEDPEIEKLIADSLSSDNMESIFGRVYYEDVKDLLKAPSRGVPTGEARSADTEEFIYENSYHYQLLMNSENTIEETETEWMDDQKQEDSDAGQQWSKYQCTDEDLAYFEKQYEQLRKAVHEMNLEEIVIQKMESKLVFLRMSFLENWPMVSQATPVCLDRFCHSAVGYTQEYLGLLAFVLRESKVRSAVVGTAVVQMIQTLFCRMDGATVKMPFYHPICVFYYLRVRHMYRYVVEKQGKDGKDALRDRIWLAMIEKAGMQFPVEYVTIGEKTYALDHATVWRSGQVVFADQNFGTVYSALDFHMMSRQILDYIRRHPLLTYIRIAVIDISDLMGLVQLVSRILHFSQQPWCNIGRVEFLILSVREEELKKQMSELWDSIGTEEMVRFRFDRNGYWDGERYQIDRVIGEADIIAIADNSMLYRKPRLVVYNNQGLKNRLEEINVERQAEREFEQRSSDIAVMWDSLQHIAETCEEDYRIWKNRELDNGLLAEINHMISECPNKAIILLSSNEHILSDIFRTQYVHAHQGGYNSSNITIIQFEKANLRRRLSDKGEPKVSYSLKEFYDRVMGLENVQRFFEESLDDIWLEFGYQDKDFYSKCEVIRRDESDTEGEWKSHCLEWIQWQMDTLFSNYNILNSCFRDALLNYLLEQAENLPSILLIERLFADDFKQFMGEISDMDITDKKSKGKSRVRSSVDKDCMEALKLHEVILFARSKASIDPQAASQFKDRYEPELLERLIECDETCGLLPIADKDKLLKIQEGIRK